jgi:hypothetical protein
MRGRFQPGRVRVPRHPLLGEIRAYGAAEVEVRGLRAVVGVDDPGGDHADDRTRIRVLRPEGRAWRVQGLRLRARPGPGADHHSGAAFARAFEVSPAAAVPDAARAALMRLAGGATALDLEPGALSFVAAWQDRTTYVADTETLRALVAELGDVAVLLLEPV